MGILSDALASINRFKNSDNKTNNSNVNPYLKSDGSLVNKYLDYQGLLNSDKVNDRTKSFISDATGLTPMQSFKNTPKTQDVSNPTTTSQNGKIGFISAKYEVGGYNGGDISNAQGYYGGTSYGIPQFSTTTGSADNFVSWLKKNNPNMASAFGNSKAGSQDFTNAWKQTYSKYGDDFSNAQTTYAYNNFVKPLAELAKQKTGVDYERSPALKELVYSTAIQFGGGNLGLKALGNVNANMSDRDIVNQSYDTKINNYKSFFSSSSPSIQDSVRNRFVNERNDVLSLIK